MKPEVTVDGHRPQGLRVRGKAELIGVLQAWLRDSHVATIGDVDSFGGRPWIWIDLDGWTVALNADAKRAAVEAVVRDNRHDPNRPWRVVANRHDRIYKVTASPDGPPLPGWYAYLPDPPARSARRRGDDLMTDTDPRFVQFPHPGNEHNPPDHDMPWNVAGHRRKFLIAPGDHVDNDGRHDDVEVVFWGEWEPPSRIERRWPPSDRLPRALHRPHWAQPHTSGFRENTDPWVFGDHMIYSVCKQITGPQRRPTSMQRLPRGSVICFGSTIAGEFCIDTVFVVASAEPWVPADVADLDVDDAFKICTGAALATTESDAHMSLTLYRGATIEQPVDGMYSFVPARRADHRHPRFARPAIQRTEVINPASRQSTWGSKRPLSPDVVRDHWEAIRHQVLAADLGLAVRLATPARNTDDSDIPDTTRQRC